jgi:hypothetical protein
VVATRFVETGDKMGAAGLGCSATDAESADELCLARGPECRAFLVAHADPFNFAVADHISDRSKRVASEAEYGRDAIYSNMRPN